MLQLKVKEILEQQNKTPYWLAKQTGIAPNNIGKICNGETTTIRFDTLEKICKALNCSVNDLFDTNDATMKRLLAYGTKLMVNNDINNKSEG